MLVLDSLEYGINNFPEKYDAFNTKEFNNLKKLRNSYLTKSGETKTNWDTLEDYKKIIDEMDVAYLNDDIDINMMVGLTNKFMGYNCDFSEWDQWLYIHALSVCCINHMTNKDNITLELIGHMPEFACTPGKSVFRILDD
jgi:hypothetical protein